MQYTFVQPLLVSWISATLVLGFEYTTVHNDELAEDDEGESTPNSVRKIKQW